MEDGRSALGIWVQYTLLKLRNLAIPCSNAFRFPAQLAVLPLTRTIREAFSLYDIGMLVLTGGRAAASSKLEN